MYTKYKANKSLFYFPKVLFFFLSALKEETEIVNLIYRMNIRYMLKSNIHLIGMQQKNTNLVYLNSVQIDVFINLPVCLRPMINPIKIIYSTSTKILNGPNFKFRPLFKTNDPSLVYIN